MRRIALILVVFTLLTGSSAAVVGHNGSNESDVSITSGSSASATTAVSENGTEYTAKVEMAGRSSEKTENEVRNISYPNSKVEFEGTITAPTPCHVIGHEITKNGTDYVMNIKTVKEETDKVCTQVISGINYEAEFETDAGFKLEIQHNGETVETTQDRVVEPKPEPKKSFFQKLLSFLGF